MKMAEGDHLEFRHSDLIVKIQNDFRNGLCVKHLIGIVGLHRFLGPFSFEVHIQYDQVMGYMAKNRTNGIGRWRPSWILIFRLIRIQKWCQKWTLYAKFSRKIDITPVPITIYFKVEFWWLDWSKYKNDARNGFSMPKLVGKVVLHSFRYQFISKSSNQVSNLTMLSVVTGPPDCTQLYNHLLIHRHSNFTSRLIFRLWKLPSNIFTLAMLIIASVMSSLAVMLVSAMLKHIHICIGV